MATELTINNTGHRFVECDGQPVVVPLDEVARSGSVRRLARISAAQLAAGSSTAGNDGSQPDPVMEFAVSVARGLSEMPRRLDSRWLYDSHGSEIFERICEQPEYYLTRTEATILAAAGADIADRTGRITMIELGSGSSIKTQLLLEAYLERHGSVCYTPVDISRSILRQAEDEIAARYPAVRVESLHGSYDDAFPLLADLSPSMLLFLGSTVGNLDGVQAADFWQKISLHLMPGDHILLGIDINEDPASLHAAYNDAAGFSTAFTRNMFERMNRELGSSLDTSAIGHAAHYVPGRMRVEIFARFDREQEIEIAPLGMSFRISRGDAILTEISRRFRLSELVPYLCTFGLQTERVYSDRRRRFALMLLKKI